jgi:hypothetical protein
MNDLAFFEAELQTSDEDPSRFKVPEAEAVQIMAKASQMAQQQVHQILTAHAQSQVAAQPAPGRGGASGPAPNQPQGAQ